MGRRRRDIYRLGSPVSHSGATKRPRIWRARTAYGNPASVGPPRSALRDSKRVDFDDAGRCRALVLEPVTAEVAVVIRDRG